MQLNTVGGAFSFAARLLNNQSLLLQLELVQSNESSVSCRTRNQQRTYFLVVTHLPHVHWHLVCVQA